MPTSHPIIAMPKPARAKPGVHYTVSIPKPTTHNFEVQVDLTRLNGLMVDLRIPAWTPGSYKIREFARNVSLFKASAGSRALRVERMDKDCWRIYLNGAKAVRVTYQCYAFELSVRTPHLDDSHGFFLPTNILPYIEGAIDTPSTLTIKPFGDWKTFCPLPRVKGKEHTFYAPDYDILGDSPVEIGPHRSVTFAVDGKHHEIVAYTFGDANLDRLARDFKKIVLAGKSMFGSLPYDNYMFILHAVPGAGGGLEHLNSQVSASRDLRFTDREKYEDYLSLISHEYFHLWNVKRLRPAMLGPFDYARETYTESLWICEGLTVYYEWLLLLRGGVIKRDRLLKAWASDIERWQGRPGNAVMGLRESSFLAWTKLYLMDENFANSGISYYLKGGLVGMLLDLEIRKRTRGRRSLDDVMRLGVERHGYPKPGFERRGFEAMVEEIAPGDWKAWFEHHLDSTTPLDLEGALAAVGLELVHDVDDKADVDSGKKEKRTKKPWLGWQLKDEKSALTISSVETGSPASTGGVSAKDELLAVNGMRVKSNSDVEQLLDYHGKGTKLALTVFRNDRLHQCSVTIGEKPAGSLVLRVMKKANVAQFKRLEDWLGKA